MPLKTDVNKCKSHYVYLFIFCVFTFCFVLFFFFLNKLERIQMRNKNYDKALSLGRLPRALHFTLVARQLARTLGYIIWSSELHYFNVLNLKTFIIRFESIPVDLSHFLSPRHHEKIPFGQQMVPPSVNGVSQETILV